MTIKKILIPLLCFIVPWSLESAVTNVQKQEAYKKARDAYNDTDIASKQRLIEAFNALSEPQKKAVAGKLPKPINAIMADVTAAKAAVIIKAAPATPPADATVEAEVQEFIDNAKFILNLVKKPDAETDITGLQDYQEMLNKNIESLKTYKTTLGSLAASGTKTLILNELTTLETRLTTQLSQVSARITTLTASAPAPTEAAVKQGVEAALADLTDEEKAKARKVLEKFKGKVKIKEAKAQAEELKRIKSQMIENRGMISLKDSSSEGIAQAKQDLENLQKNMPDFTKLIKDLGDAIKHAESHAQSPAPAPGPEQTRPGVVQTPAAQEVEHQRAVLTEVAKDIRAAEAILSSQTAQISAIDNNLQQLEQAKKMLETEVSEPRLSGGKTEKLGEIQDLINRLNKKKVALAGATPVPAPVEAPRSPAQTPTAAPVPAPTAPELPQLRQAEIQNKSQEISAIEKAVREFKKVPGAPERISEELDKAANAVILLEAQKIKNAAVNALLDAAIKARDELTTLLEKAKSTSGLKGALAPALAIPGVVLPTAPRPVPAQPAPAPAPANVPSTPKEEFNEDMFAGKEPATIEDEFSNFTDQQQAQYKDVIKKALQKRITAENDKDKKTLLESYLATLED